MIPSTLLNLKLNTSNTESLELLDELDNTIYTPELLSQYFTGLYKELAKRGGTESKGILKTIFLEYLNLPGIVGERVYSKYDKAGKEYITEVEFISVSIYLFSSEFEDKLKIVFDLLDFNEDSKIEANDILTFISHIPLQKMEEKKEEDESKYNIRLNLSNINTEDRLQSFKEIQQLIEYIFRDKEFITLEEFKDITENKTSDLFICV